MPEISVIVPVYNAEKYLKRSIESILNQSYKDFELILIDDGSTDSSGTICDEFSQKDNRVHTYHQTNQGQAAARNFAIKKSLGKWISFVDSDDVVHPKMLEILYDACRSKNVQLSMCGAIEEHEIPADFWIDRFEGKYSEINITDETLYEICMNGKHRYWVVWGKLISKKIVEKLSFTNGKIYEDNAIVPKWLHSAEKIANVEMDLYFYQKNEEGTTKKAFSIKQLDLLWALEEQIMFFETTKYKIMLSALCSHYLKISPLYYKRTLHELKNVVEANRIKKKSIKVLRKHWRKINLNKAEIYEVLEMFFPIMMSLYSKIKILISERNR